VKQRKRRHELRSVRRQTRLLLDSAVVPRREGANGTFGIAAKVLLEESLKGSPAVGLGVLPCEGALRRHSEHRHDHHNEPRRARHHLPAGRPAEYN
jgi:hypothetical protein